MENVGDRPQGDPFIWLAEMYRVVRSGRPVKENRERFGAKVFVSGTFCLTCPGLFNTVDLNRQP
jgi:hypothetical protein